MAALGTPAQYSSGFGAITIDERVLVALGDLASVSGPGGRSSVKRAAQDARAVSAILGRSSGASPGSASVRVPGVLIRALEQRLAGGLEVTWEGDGEPATDRPAPAPVPAALDAFRRAEDDERRRLARRGVVTVGGPSGAIRAAMPAPRGPVAVALVIVSSGIAVAALLSLAARIGGDAGRSPFVTLGVAGVFIVVDAVLITRMLWMADREGAADRAKAEAERARKRDDRRAAGAAAEEEAAAAGAKEEAAAAAAPEASAPAPPDEEGSSPRAAPHGPAPAVSPPHGSGPAVSPEHRSMAKQAAATALRRRRGKKAAAGDEEEAKEGEERAEEEEEEEVGEEAAASADSSASPAPAARPGAAGHRSMGLSQALAEALAREAAEAAGAMRAASAGARAGGSGGDAASEGQSGGGEPGGGAADGGASGRDGGDAAGSGPDEVTDGGWVLVG